MDFASDDFSKRAAKRIMSRRTFFFEVTGDRARELKPFLINGTISDESLVRMVVKPKLRPLSIVLSLARGQDMPIPVLIEEREESIAVWVGVGTT